MARKKRVVGFLRKLALIGSVALFLLMASFVLWTSFPQLRPYGTVEMPEVPAVDQATMERARSSQAGQEIRKLDYVPVRVESDTELIEFLDEQQRKVGVDNPGPYVRFSNTSVQASKPSTEVSPDVIIDATTGVIAALAQDFSNQRGTACFNTRGTAQLSHYWVVINVHLWNKSLFQQIPVSHNEVSQIPEGMGVIPCYTYMS